MIRITGGTLRGRRFEVPAGIRPTMEMARKAAFDILGPRIQEAAVLDAAAGSGAYGIEAISRGARLACFVESDRFVAGVLRRSLESLPDPEKARLVVQPLATYLARQPADRFDVIFHDPPYGKDETSDLVGLLRLLAPGGTLIHERGDHRAPATAGEPADHRRYGKTHLFLYRPSAAVDPASPLS